MKKLLLLILLILVFNFNIFSLQKVGIPILYSPYKDAYKDITVRLEEELLNLMSDIQESELFSLNINESNENIKKIIKIWKVSQNDPSNLDDKTIKIIDELKLLDYCVFYELKLFNFKKESDFYDVNKLINNIKIDLRILIIDCKEKTIFKEDFIIIETKNDKTEDIAKKDALDKIIFKTKNFIMDLNIFKPKIYCEVIKPILVRINKGKNDKIKAQNILAFYEENGYNISESTVLKVLWAFDNYSIASILWTKGEINENTAFYKKNKINLEVQICGGFSISDGENQISTSNNIVSFLPFVSIRTLIPVGLSFFRPGFHLEFNVFYAENKIILPITFEAGFQFEVNIHRFQTDLGFMFGALFAPDKNSNYLVDSFIVRPYLHLSAILISSTKLFGEVGYRYYLEGTFYKDYKINLNGIYFLFGIGITL